MDASPEEEVTGDIQAGRDRGEALEGRGAEVWTGKLSQGARERRDTAAPREVGACWASWAPLGSCALGREAVRGPLENGPRGMEKDTVSGRCGDRLRTTGHPPPAPAQHHEISRIPVCPKGERVRATSDSLLIAALSKYGIEFKSILKIQCEFDVLTECVIPNSYEPHCLKKSLF